MHSEYPPLVQFLRSNDNCGNVFELGNDYGLSNNLDIYVNQLPASVKSKLNRQIWDSLFRWDLKINRPDYGYDSGHLLTNEKEVDSLISAYKLSCIGYWDTKSEGRKLANRRIDSFVSFIKAMLHQDNAFVYNKDILIYVMSVERHHLQLDSARSQVFYKTRMYSLNIL
ncbi:MAG: hypothetical protein JSS82_08915 [Bacteroidetes bacterium]|nr:hypothetical protein [Bacteroidota bacterium]